jgi:hypothetical protein
MGNGVGLDVDMGHGWNCWMVFEIPTLLYMKEQAKSMGCFLLLSRFLCSCEQQFSHLEVAQGSMKITSAGTTV